ncbi:MAG: DNA gyrase subunit A, partial [Alicyclobacillaceae bacterium]|nr:DNA gyrase subunit A [Alicyclobacillaceae bacterium]
ELVENIKEFKEILADEQKILAIIKKELLEIKSKYADPRRTRITAGEGEIEEEDLIPVEDVAITLSHTGYIKRQPMSLYRSQRRGGRGITAVGTKEEDFVEHLFITSSHHYLLFFTNKGKVYRLKAYEVPELGRTAKGMPIVNLLNIEQGEQISAVIPIPSFTSGEYLIMATRQGVIKKTALEEFENIRKAGLMAITLRENDELIAVRRTDGNRELILGTKMGMSIRFPETDVRPMGRSATGVKAMELDDGDVVIDMDVVDPEGQVLVVTSGGFGKRTPITEYRQQTRGGKGIKTLHVTPRNGHVVGLKMVRDDEDLMLITTTGVAIRFPVHEISILGRNTQGVKLISLKEDEEVSTVAKVVKHNGDE